MVLAFGGMSRKFITPFDAIQTANNVLRNTRQTEALCEYQPHELLRLAFACIASDWDVTPDQLDERQRRDILTGLSDVPDFVETRHGLEPNGCKENVWPRMGG